MSSLSRPPLDRRALGLALTRIANGQPASYPGGGTPGEAWRIGITGAPGAGKSTLTGRLALRRLRERRLAVLAIDPSSPVSGGAILGDRIRMDDLAGVEELFIRSFGARSSADGLTEHLSEVFDLMAQAGFDELLLETVGVGQAEVAVRDEVDTLVLVVPPDAGDAIQAMKAGMLEMADIFAVSKADTAPAERMAHELERIVELTRVAPAGWRPPVVLTSAQRPESVQALSAAIDRHRAWLLGGADGAARRLARARSRLRRRLERRLGQAVATAPEAWLAQPLAEQERALLRRLLDGASG